MMGKEERRVELVFVREDLLLADTELAVKQEQCGQ
jgi:hypothetical protein